MLSAVAVAAIAVLVIPTLHDTKVVEEFPEAAAEPTVPTTALTGITTPPATTPPAAPVKISTGALRGIGHDATGTASIYRRPNGTTVVALESIDIEPGPDYRVIIVRGADQERPGDGLELDALRGNQGTQYYEVPPEPTLALDGPCSSGAARSVCPSPTPPSRRSENLDLKQLRPD